MGIAYICAYKSKSMKHIILVASIFLFAVSSVSAQKKPVELNWECTAIPGTDNEYECALVAGHFDEILSLQFTIKWNADQTEFLKFVPIELPELNKNNVNTNTAPEGFMRFLWVDLTLNGVNLVPGTQLFSLHVKTSEGQPEIKLASEPLNIEIMDKDNISRHLKWK